MLAQQLERMQDQLAVTLPRAENPLVMPAGQELSGETGVQQGERLLAEAAGHDGPRQVRHLLDVDVDVRGQRQAVTVSLDDP